RRPGAILLVSGGRPGRAAKHPQRAGRPGRTGPARRRDTEPLAPGLPQRPGPPRDRRIELPPGGPAPGTHRRQRRETLGARPGPVPPTARRGAVNPTDPTAPPDTPGQGVSCLSDDSSLIEAVRQFQQAMQAGQVIDRDAFLARYPGLAGQLAPCLDGLLVL